MLPPAKAPDVHCTLQEVLNAAAAGKLLGEGTCGSVHAVSLGNTTMALKAIKVRICCGPLLNSSCNFMRLTIILMIAIIFMAMSVEMWASRNRDVVP